MIPVKFYESLDYDFSYLNGEDNLNGLTLGGFNGGNKPLNIDNFDIIELLQETLWHAILKWFNASIKGYLHLD